MTTLPTINDAAAPGPALLRVVRIGPADAATELVWAHGWGQTGAVFAETAAVFDRRAASLLLDFPGFGAAPLPPETWGTAEYADDAASWLRAQPPARRLWIGHSFGCRVGLQLAARHPGLLDGLVLVAAAGLKRRRGPIERVQLGARIRLFKLLKACTPEGPARERLYARFGSADSRAAGPLRRIFVRVVNEDLSAAAARVRCPTLLLYGNQDRDTPPEIGERLARLIPGAELHVLNGFDHHTILDTGRHQLANEIRRMLERLECSPPSP